MTNEVAERYAQGLFELAKENGTVKEKKDQAENLLKVLEENPDVEVLYRAVKLTKEEKKAFTDQVFAKAVDTDMIHFMKLIIDKGRSFYLKEILRGYVDLADESLGIAHGTVASARPLSEKDMKSIQEALEKKTGKTVVLTNKTDPSLIAGIKVTLGNNVTDITMKTKIENMRSALLKGGQA